jgi:hypothetical protein
VRAIRERRFSVDICVEPPKGKNAFKNHQPKKPKRHARSRAASKRFDSVSQRHAPQNPLEPEFIERRHALKFFCRDTLQPSPLKNYAKKVAVLQYFTC